MSIEVPKVDTCEEAYQVLLDQIEAYKATTENRKARQCVLIALSALIQWNMTRLPGTLERCVFHMVTAVAWDEAAYPILGALIQLFRLEIAENERG